MIRENEKLLIIQSVSEKKITTFREPKLLMSSPCCQIIPFVQILAHLFYMTAFLDQYMENFSLDKLYLDLYS